MFRLYADKTQLLVREQEPVTSGSINVYPVQFSFSPDWEGLTKTVFFSAGDRMDRVFLDTDNICFIPAGVLTAWNRPLTVSVSGSLGGEIVLPSRWAFLGTIQEGAPGGDNPGGGVSDHRLLTHRDTEDQHPIEAISGLEEISNLEVLKIWNGG